MLDPNGQRDRRMALGLGTAFFIVYCATLCRTVFWYDSAEYVTAAVTLGIPHPPGYPLYTILAHVFTWLPIDPSLAVNGMSATFAAVAVALVYLIGRELELGRLPSAVGAALLGASKLFWYNALIAEVYCPALATMAVVILLLLRARKSGRLRNVLLAAFVAGIALGIHLSIATFGLGFAFLVWSFDERIEGLSQLGKLFAPSTLKRRFLRSGAAAGAALLGSSIFLYLPIRASMGPALNFGDPSTWERFVWHITGGNYKNWFNPDLAFFDRASTIAGFFYDQLQIVGLALAVAGAARLFRARPVAAIAFFLMLLGNIYFFFSYSVHDLDVFFLPSTLILCCLASAGAQLVLDGLARVVSEAKLQSMQKLLRGALVIFVIAVALGNYRTVDMSDFNDTDEYIDAMVEQLPPNAIILDFTTPPEWKLNAVFGMYVQKVLHRRLDVSIIGPPTPKELVAMIKSGKLVFTYVPLGALRGFEVVPEGPVYRIAGPRLRRPPRPGPP